MPPLFEAYDIAIVGAGPVGLLLSVFLARWGYKIKHVDNRAEPTPTGRADGIQPRSLSLLDNMDLLADVMAYKPAKVFEVAFWDPTTGGGIHRTGTWPSCPDFIDARFPFTALLHQGLIERIFIKDMARHNTHVQRPWTITDFENDGSDPLHPVRINLASADGQGSKESIRAKYLFSGEGGRSTIRQKLGIEMQYKDPIAHVWGVMDGIVKTNFPDIKMKCTIHSTAGSIMIIPRENNMVRLYIQIASSTDKDWDPRKAASAEEVQQHAKDILQPYFIEWETVEWYSVYPIGQGIAKRYTLDERVFMGGDSCHTHSPKAGQGMNAAFLDAQNFSWKLHLVESGFVNRSILESYESERRHIADELLNFDAKYAKLFSTNAPAKDVVHEASQPKGGKDEDKQSPSDGSNEFLQTFKENCEFTSGYGVTYQPNILNWSPAHPAKSPLFLQYPHETSQRTGRVMTTSTVTRVSDANTVWLENEVPANGAFRIFIFAGSYTDSQKRKIADFAKYTTAENSFLTRFLRSDIAHVSHHEKHLPHSHFFTFCTIIAAKRPEIEIDELPSFLKRYRDHVYADDMRDMKVLDAKAAAHTKMGFGEGGGGVLVVRPDGYVGCVAKLIDGSGTVDALDEYFASFCTAGTQATMRAQL